MLRASKTACLWMPGSLSGRDLLNETLEWNVLSDARLWMDHIILKIWIKKSFGKSAKAWGTPLLIL